MAWSITKAEALSLNPCDAPDTFKGNRYFDEGTQTFTLPNGWDTEAISYTINERGESALLFWASARWPDGSKVAPISLRDAWAAIKAEREAKKLPAPPP